MPFTCEAWEHGAELHHSVGLTLRTFWVSELPVARMSETCPKQSSQPTGSNVGGGIFRATVGGENAFPRAAYIPAPNTSLLSCAARYSNEAHEGPRRR